MKQSCMFNKRTYISLCHWINLLLVFFAMKELDVSSLSMLQGMIVHLGYSQ